MDELFHCLIRDFYNSFSNIPNVLLYFTVCGCVFVLFCGSGNYKEVKCGSVIGNYFLKIGADPKLMQFPLKTVHSLSPEAFTSP